MESDHARTRAIEQEATADDVLRKRIGTANAAATGIDIALIDIGGKVAKVPTCRLLRPAAADREKGHRRAHRAFVFD